MYCTWLGRSHFPGTVALWIMHGIWDLPSGKDSIQGDGIVLDNGPVGPIFLVWIGHTLWVLECTVHDWDVAIFLVHRLFQFHGISDTVLWFMSYPSVAAKTGLAAENEVLQRYGEKCWSICISIYIYVYIYVGGRRGWLTVHNRDRYSTINIYSNVDQDDIGI